MTSFPQLRNLSRGRESRITGQPYSTTALKGRKVTCFHSIKDDVENVGGTYVNQEVCINGNVTTSGTPEDLPAFVVALMEMMRKG